MYSLSKYQHHITLFNSQVSVCNFKTQQTPEGYEVNNLFNFFFPKKRDFKP